jgi:non-canonical (house-cleaning) NTP pyrophosphatase
MPYSIKKVKGGFKVSDGKRSDGVIKYFSNKPLTKTVAEKQRIAVALSESKKTGKPIDSYFI